MARAELEWRGAAESERNVERYAGLKMREVGGCEMVVLVVNKQERVPTLSAAVLLAWNNVETVLVLGITDAEASGRIQVLHVETLGITAEEMHVGRSNRLDKAKAQTVVVLVCLKKSLRLLDQDQLLWKLDGSLNCPNQL